MHLRELLEYKTLAEVNEQWANVWPFVTYHTVVPALDLLSMQYVFGII